MLRTEILNPDIGSEFLGSSHGPEHVEDSESTEYIENILIKLAFVDLTICSLLLWGVVKNNRLMVYSWFVVKNVCSVAFMSWVCYYAAFYMHIETIREHFALLGGVVVSVAGLVFLLCVLRSYDSFRLEDDPANDELKESREGVLEHFIRSLLPAPHEMNAVEQYIRFDIN